MAKLEINEVQSGIIIISNLGMTFFKFEGFGVINNQFSLNVMANDHFTQMVVCLVSWCGAVLS